MSDDPFAMVAAQFCKGLEVQPAPSQGGYRGAAETPLQGEWLGGYSEPRMLEPYSPMRVVFAGPSASGEDDSGVSEWTLVGDDGDDLEWLKTYTRAEWLYRGRKQPHAFIGAWTSPNDARRTGCFWLVPANRLSDAHATKLRRGAKRRFWPAIGAQLVSLALIAGSIPSIAILPWWLFPTPFVLVWLALKDALQIPGSAQQIERAMNELRVRVEEEEAEELGAEADEETSTASSA